VLAVRCRSCDRAATTAHVERAISAALTLWRYSKKPGESFAFGGDTCALGRVDVDGQLASAVDVHVTAARERGAIKITTKQRARLQMWNAAATQSLRQLPPTRWRPAPFDMRRVLPHSRGRRASRISRVARHSACANGRRPRSLRAGWCRGSRSHSAAGPSSISPSKGSPRHGQQPCCNIELAGFVEVREERERSDRIVVRLQRTDSARLNQPLERVRVSVRKGTAPAVGSFVEFKARLSPPLEPLRPGAYDFARDMYFQRIGASGFVLGRIRTAEAPHAPGLRLRYATAMDGMREAIDKRIRAVLPGDKGAIASALITGRRDTISTPVNEAMYVSGLAHVLSISGYHMAVVAGLMFFVFRALFALMPAFSSRLPIKK